MMCLKYFIFITTFTIFVQNSSCADLVGELLELTTESPGPNGESVPASDCDANSLKFRCMIQNHWWIWKHLLAYTVICLVLWLFLVIITACVAKRTQGEYQPISKQEEDFLEQKRNLREGFMPNSA